MSEVTVRCEFCERLFLMQRPLFFSEREHAACPACRAEAKRNLEKMRDAAHQQAKRVVSLHQREEKGK